ncbi:iron chelate uptake ABC transporter family permease subunit [Corynebacterium uropygiale]|uniref:Iron chelate uptake ABC transporter family permease subunit n=1 Tax=Corynebacterium uropygiale TaxID=1775911 RepID=A0A9X1QLW8_9CORY|nr:iron chelate uptake ABC transporter family permease subunit [Corynebacterium uropygiale]MCF4005667.1 iron chelate uptake ABC transporter family permease subunit [Corynebacterium uropygiale]
MRTAWGLVLLAVALLGALVASVAIGARAMSLPELWQALHHQGDPRVISTVWDMRVPRTVTGFLVGVAYGLAGVVIQALTRNPLADSGILGVNAGAGFAVTLTVGLLGPMSMAGLLWPALLGSALATVAVYLIGSAGQWTADPLSLVLAGVALGTLLGGVSSFLTLIDPDTFQSLHRWNLGSIGVSSLHPTLTVAPLILLGVVLAVALARPLNAIALGDELAQSLGVRVVAVRTVAVIVVTLLAGASTALTGGIGFVGLMVPHVVRWFTGPEQRRIMAGTILAAPALVLLADVVGRVLMPPHGIEVGLVTSLIGAPVLIALVRRKKVSAL